MVSVLGIQCPKTLLFLPNGMVFFQMNLILYGSDDYKQVWFVLEWSDTKMDFPIARKSPWKELARYILFCPLVQSRVGDKSSFLFLEDLFVVLFLSFFFLSL